MSNFQYYSTINPTLGELVLVEFTKRNDSFFDANLIEYPYRGMMSYSDASKRRKVSSWNKIVPINKLMVARVDIVDESAKIVHISTAYLDEFFNEKNLSISDIQNKLMVQFNENKLMENFIKSICIQTECNFEQLWTSLVHHIDSERRKFNEDCHDDPITLWQYLSNNFDRIDDFCLKTNVTDKIVDSIKNTFTKRTEDSIKKITSKIKIISPNGISQTKILLEKCLKDIQYEHTFRYLSAPDYLFESSTKDSDQDNHHKLIEKLQLESQKMNPKVYIQVVPAEIAHIIG